MRADDELRRALRDADPGQPASLERLLAAMNRVGISGVTRHYALLGLDPDGPIMHRGRIFEVLADGATVRFRVAHHLGYGIAFGPNDIWAEAEVIETALGGYAMREKVRSTGSHGGALDVDFTVVDAPSALRERCDAHGRSARLHIGTLYDATQMAMAFAFEEAGDGALALRDWDRALDR